MANKTDLKKQKLEDAPPIADVETPHAEPDGDEGQDKVLSALAAIEARLTKLEAGKDEDKEQLAEDEPPVKDEEREEEMATMAAKVCSVMLAKVGIRPRSSNPVAGDQPEKTELSADEQKMAKALGIDHKQFAANLAVANKRMKL
jgi:hypothetical protein